MLSIGAQWLSHSRLLLGQQVRSCKRNNAFQSHQSALFWLTKPLTHGVGWPVEWGSVVGRGDRGLDRSDKSAAQEYDAKGKG